ncbi:MAG TPA: oxygenase MpaB family protein [Nocardioidaceae bacterium]|nr:oxygenase MpaB family protein [Nocardioidaceae bacterium]
MTVVLSRSRRTVRRPLPRDHWQRVVADLDPAVDYERITRISTAYEFPWDTAMSLSLALFRTFAVPSIGGLLHETGEFTTRPQKRYDDTSLILDAIGLHGMASPRGRAAIRRMNQLHRTYDISNDDMAYVASTFVVVPTRWNAAYGWRRLLPIEIDAAVAYWDALGRRMGIQGLPTTYEGFERLMDGYEREHFAFDPRCRAVADATLDLAATFYPGVGQRMARSVTLSLLDAPLLRALGYDQPSPHVRAAAEAMLRLRARAIRRLPPRRRPFSAERLRWVRSYPNGYVIDRLGPT